MKTVFFALMLMPISSFTLLAPKKKPEPLSPDHDKIMTYIPAQSFNYFEINPEDYDLNQKSVVISVQGFYMSPYEVTNGEYFEYIYNLKLKGDTAAYRKALPDTTVWRDKLAYNEPYVEYYFRHPAYRKYPMVGITHEQSKKYCEWLTEQYNASEKRKYKKVKFRLPTKHEWYAAASGNLNETETKKGVKTLYSQHENIFPWDGPYMRNKEGKVLANFRVVEEGSVYREYDSVMTVYGKKDLRMRYVVSGFSNESIAGFLNDAADITMPVNAYWPNDAGMYNMGGNVEEFVEEYGVTKGGSWEDPGFYLRNQVVETYTSAKEATSKRGFRFVMEVVEE